MQVNVALFEAKSGDKGSHYFSIQGCEKNSTMQVKFVVL